jgi:hypothetical protein
MSDEAARSASQSEEHKGHDALVNDSNGSDESMARESAEKDRLVRQRKEREKSYGERQYETAAAADAATHALVVERRQETLQREKERQLEDALQEEELRERLREKRRSQMAWLREKRRKTGKRGAMKQRRQGAAPQPRPGRGDPLQRMAGWQEVQRWDGARGETGQPGARGPSVQGERDHRTNTQRRGFRP